MKALGSVEGVATVLDRILEAHRRAAAADDRPVAALAEEAARGPAPRDFRAALAGGGGVSVIAEVKRRSPSKGDLAVELVPSLVAKQYAEGGAACLSVLTDAEFFGGSPSDLQEARAAVDLPVLRKDFTVSERDVCDARLMGADAVLLIVAALTTSELARLRSLAADLDLAVLVEVHDAGELERALAAGADIVGVNQRDLRTFEVDRDLAGRLAPSIPGGVVKVAESGVRDAGDVAGLARAGYDAVLVGESLVTAPDPAAAVRALTLGGS
jgi:indole-3-glycerol phosphate synthase